MPKNNGIVRQGRARRTSKVVIPLGGLHHIHRTPDYLLSSSLRSISSKNSSSVSTLTPISAFLWVARGGGRLPPAGHTQRNQANPTAGGPRQSQRDTPNTPIPAWEVPSARTSYSLALLQSAFNLLEELLFAEHLHPHICCLAALALWDTLASLDLGTNLQYSTAAVQYSDQASNMLIGLLLQCTVTATGFWLVLHLGAR